MVCSPGPVHAGFGLDDGEVLAHLAVVAFGLFSCRHYSPLKVYLSIYMDIVAKDPPLFPASNIGFYVGWSSYPTVPDFLRLKPPFLRQVS